MHGNLNGVWKSVKLFAKHHGNTRDIVKTTIDGMYLPYTKELAKLNRKDIFENRNHSRKDGFQLNHLDLWSGFDFHQVRVGREVK